MLARRRQYIATLISRFLDPLVVFSLVGLVALARSDLTVAGKLLFLEILVLAMIAPPFLLLAWAVAKKKISDWDISKRKQRPLALIILMILTLLDLVIVYTFGDASLFHLFILFFVWLSGFLLVTVFWKISGHAGAVALSSGLLIAWFGGGAYLTLLLIPLVSWARIVRHDHVLAQTVAGALYSLGLVWMFWTLRII